MATPLSDVDKEISLLIRAKFPILSIVSHEEWRFLAQLEEIREEVIKGRRSQLKGQLERSSDETDKKEIQARLDSLDNAHQILRWTSTDGLLHWSRYDEKGRRRPRPLDLATEYPNVDSRDPVALLRSLRLPPKQPIPVSDGKHVDLRSAIYVFCDLHAWLDRDDRAARFNHVLVRALRDMAYLFKQSQDPSVMIFLSPRTVVPFELEKEIQIIDYPLPTVDELEARFESRVPLHKNDHGEDCIELSSSDRRQLMQALSGLTFDEADSVLAKALAEKGKLQPNDVAAALKEKRQIIKKDGTLEYVDNDKGLNDVGGLLPLRDWLIRRRMAFLGKTVKVNDIEVKLPMPKGILLIGVPGGGKSLVAKAVAMAWGLPLLRLDIGRIFGGTVGQSEENMRRAIRIAKSVSPAVLWCDEVEKAFPKTHGGGDSGTSLRVMNTFLTWMQEKTEPVFVVATGNDLTQIPPELTRKGRFDEIFYVGLPKFDSRLEILKIHTRRYTLDPADLDLLAKKSIYFTGAEIEQCVKDAHYALQDYVAAGGPPPGAGEPERPFPRAIYNVMGSFAPLAKRDDAVFRETYHKARAMAVPADKFEDLPAPVQQNVRAMVWDT